MTSSWLDWKEVGESIRGHFFTGCRTLRWQVRRRRGGSAAWAMVDRTLLTNSPWAGSLMSPCAACKTMSKAPIGTEPSNNVVTLERSKLTESAQP